MCFGAPNYEIYTYVSSKNRHKVTIKQTGFLSYFATSDVLSFLDSKGVASLTNYEYSLISFIGQWLVHFLLHLGTCCYWVNKSRVLGTFA